MQPSLMFTDDPQPQRPKNPDPFFAAAIIVSTISLVIVLADAYSGSPLVPESVRDIFVASMVGVWPVWYFRTQISRVMNRLNQRGACCAEAYVDGLARRPFNGPYGRD